MTAALALFLLDDQFFSKKLPAILTRWYQKLTALPEPLLKQIINGAVAVLIGILSVINFLGYYNLPPALESVFAPIQRLNLVNSYGLFAVMTTERNEIVIEGSDDSVNWKVYEFFYKPGTLKQAPPVVAPMQPRLDWQMWFAALAPAEISPWFSNLLVRIFHNDHEVMTLLKKNPFPDRPPSYLRASLYRYEFSTWDELFKRGIWWKRSYVAPFIPTVKNEFTQNKTGDDQN